MSWPGARSRSQPAMEDGYAGRSRDIIRLTGLVGAGGGEASPPPSLSLEMRKQRSACDQEYMPQAAKYLRRAKSLDMTSQVYALNYLTLLAHNCMLHATYQDGQPTSCKLQHKITSMGRTENPSAHRISHLAMQARND